MDTRQFHKQLFDAARRLIPRDAAVICGVSGGADSMALLHGLCAVNRMRRCGWRLHVAHLDHKLPHDSAAMMEFVRRAAAALELPCTTDSADVIARSQATGRSIEDVGREVRYAFLHRVARSLAAGVVVVGHHADDQAETVLHRVCRGTGLRGLAGMPQRRPILDGSDIQLVRPMLAMRRDDLAAYLQHRGISFMHDETNDDTSAATRNCIRHIVLPQIEQTINPNVVAALARLAEQADRAHQAMRKLAAEALENIRLSGSVRRMNRSGAPTLPGVGDRPRGSSIISETGFAVEPGEICLDADAFAGLPRALQTEIVVLAVSELGLPLRDLAAERIEAAADAGLGDGRRRRIEMPGGMVVERRGRRLRFIPSDRGAGCEANSDKSPNPVALVSKSVAPVSNRCRTNTR